MYTKIGGLSKNEADELVFETIKEMLGRGEKSKISPFGNLVPRDKGSRRGRNPQTGEQLALAARRILVFKASPVLRLALNPRVATEATRPRSSTPLMIGLARSCDAAALRRARQRCPAHLIWGSSGCPAFCPLK